MKNHGKEGRQKLSCPSRSQMLISIDYIWLFLPHPHGFPVVRGGDSYQWWKEFLPPAILLGPTRTPPGQITRKEQSPLLVLAGVLGLVQGLLCSRLGSAR